jgi:hypothetical protein
MTAPQVRIVGSGKQFADRLPPFDVSVHVASCRTVRLATSGQIVRPFDRRLTEAITASVRDV